ncbi:hypothetical protein COT99_03795 [Candidatus Falkowbacteria bacterium CG10_big_fil_rev_8_21_14_0_10_43_10]|uniref:DNA 3'-5' helicase n=1 Tax=Candidatus Falkowbacteria bacterium CG10_big_fil_rev_8_21_14_0_10_43_10 TaxID=1974567 RepID=A0A2H0V1D8_9BACT|nr:MAG: hypothetical protein COT99_03795 [Candidatus Falkowbacteria bacterium CG10_big_fil_rev_8_21_14_0_10_43_10]
MYKLNKEQLKAVEHTGSPLLIVAGAGTGKTTVITQKIGWLAERELAQPDEILALTFTEKAAGEMEERVDKIMPYGYMDMWVMTFHGFCEKILQQHGLDIGLPTNFKLLNEFGQWALVKKNLDKFNLDYYRPLGNQTKFISALLKHFSRAKDEDTAPQQYLEYAEELKENVDSMLSGKAVKRRGNDKFPKINSKEIINSKLQIQKYLGVEGGITKEIAEQEIARINEVANAYYVYQQLLLDNNVLDFGDLINYTLKLFRGRPAILAKFQQKFKYILVDEFQDTNWAQYELVKLLSPQGKNLTVVGDDDQSIFRFRGASMSNILQFKKDYPDASEVVLTQNYRSAQNILDIAYKFIKLNDPNRLEHKFNENAETDFKPVSAQGINKKLQSQNDIKGVIEVIQGNDLQDEVNKVIKKIAELKNLDKQSTWNDFVILVRANATAKEFINALEINSIPYIFLASRGLYSRPLIMDIIAYLNLLDNYHENTSLYRVLNIPVFKFRHEEIIGFLQLAKKKAWSLYETIKYLSNFSAESKDKIQKLINLIEKQTALIKQKKASEIILAFLQDSGYVDYLENLEDEREKKENMRELNAFIMKRVKEFEAEAGDASVKNFLAELNLEIESGEEGSLLVDPDEGPEMVKVSTVHAAKGLEFKYVFIVGLVDLRFPTAERKDPILLPDALVKEILPRGDVHLEEERRLFYVAMTRAKQSLYFSWAPDYGGQRKKKPSRFLAEMKLVNPGAEFEQSDRPAGPAAFAPPVAPPPKFVYPIPKFYSYTQLQSYDKCPYNYYINHVLKIPKSGKHFFSFGQTMHLALQKFFTLVMQSQSAAQADLFGQAKTAAQTRAFLSLDRLLELYEESWIDDWYEDKGQKEKYKKKGKDILREFYRKHDNNWPRVIGLEQGLRLRIGEYTLYGKVDRIDDLGERGAQIVDYKTGEAKTGDKITNEQKYQLLLYQLAATEVLRRKPANLQFYYLDNNSEVNFLGEQKDIAKMQEWVLNVIARIETSLKTGDFPHGPNCFCKKSDDVGEFLSL